MPEETNFDRYLTPEQYQAQNVGRGQVLEDLETLRGLQQTGGPAVQEARALQQEQAKGQIALQRGMDTGGRGERMGTEAAAKSYVESQAPVAMIKEAATQGYAREEVGAAGLLAMSDTQFEQAIKGFLAQESDVKKQAGQGKTAAVIGGVASGAASGAMVGGLPGAIIGGLGGGLMGYAAKDGGVVPGVGSEDTVPARLAPGEIVIPKELSAQLMEVMSRSVGGGDVVRAQTGGVVRRDPQTGYLVEDENAAALMQMALLDERLKRGDLGMTSAWYHTPEARLGGGRHSIAPAPAPVMPEQKARFGGGEGALYQMERELGDVAPYAMPQGARLERRQVTPNYAQPARYGGGRKGVARGGGSFTQEDAKALMEMVEAQKKKPKKKKSGKGRK